MASHSAPDLHVGGDRAVDCGFPQPVPQSWELNNRTTGSSGNSTSEAMADALKFLAELRSQRGADLPGPKDGRRAAAQHGSELQPPQQPLPQQRREASPAGLWRPNKDSLIPSPVRSAPEALSRACASRALAGDSASAGAGHHGHKDQRVRSEADEQENAYLKRNVEHLKVGKRQLEAQVENLRIRVQSLEEQNLRYKTFWEQPKGVEPGGSLEMEMDNLQQKLTAVQMLKEALNTENIELQRRLDAAMENLRAEQKEQKHTQCVVCMDNLANVVCLPCKHLALCSSCGAPEKKLASCPICRTAITDRLQVFMP